MVSLSCLQENNKQLIETIINSALDIIMGSIFKPPARRLGLDEYYDPVTTD